MKYHKKPTTDKCEICGTRDLKASLATCYPETRWPVRLCYGCREDDLRYNAFWNAPNAKRRK